jgi:polyisoprenyl-phosphate glycosyltransferase
VGEAFGDLQEGHTVAVVVPVYKGETTLAAVVDEVSWLFEPHVSDDGHRLHVAEVLLVHDNGPDDSPRVIRELEAKHPQVRAVWLTRNFGQHAATLAGMASSGSDWIVTMDEDGQHDPRAIPSFLDTAMREQAGVVYAAPTNPPPHGALRNAASRATKRVASRLVPGSDIGNFQSYRLILGDVGRSVAAYAGAGVYLDIALGWVNRRVATTPVALRQESSRASGYSARTLASHFWRLVLSSGTRGLRLVSLLGVSFAVIGVLVAIYAVVGRFLGTIDEPGWTSVMVMVCLGFGVVLFSLGVVAEYLGVAVNMAMGRPSYLITDDPARGPLGRSAAVPARDG